MNDTADNTTKNGKCSLREALNAANGDTRSVDCKTTGSGFDTIVLQEGKTYTVKTKLQVTADLAITVPAGGSRPKLTGTTDFQVLVVNPGVSLFLDHLSMPNVRGTAIDLRDTGFLLLDHVDIHHGEIKGAGGNNTGGIDVRPGAEVDLFDSEIHDMSGFRGGAIANGPNATTFAIRSSFYNNTVREGGGAILNATGTLDLVNTTISGNSAGKGGGVLTNVDTRFNLPASFTHCTITANSALERGGGGIDAVGAQGLVFLTNTIVSDHPDAANCSGTLTSQGNNLFGPLFDCTILNQSNDIIGRGANLAPLDLNGGDTHCHAPRPGSFAIDNASDATCNPRDQRDVSRPVDGNGDGIAACDIGSVEAL